MDTKNSERLNDDSLANQWTFWMDSWEVENDDRSVVSGLKPLGNHSNAKSFWDFLDTFSASSIPNSGSLHIFKFGIQPSYEDLMNSKGGHFKLSLSGGDNTDRIWTVINQCLIRGHFPNHNDVNGVSLMKKNTAHAVKIWLRNSLDKDHIEQVRIYLTAILDPDHYSRVRFCPHRPSANSNTVRKADEKSGNEGRQSNRNSRNSKGNSPSLIPSAWPGTPPTSPLSRTTNNNSSQNRQSNQQTQGIPQMQHLQNLQNRKLLQQQTQQRLGQYYNMLMHYLNQNITQLQNVTQQNQNGESDTKDPQNIWRNAIQQIAAMQLAQKSSLDPNVISQQNSSNTTIILQKLQQFQQQLYPNNEGAANNSSNMASLQQFLKQLVQNQPSNDNSPNHLNSNDRSASPPLNEDKSWSPMPIGDAPDFSSLRQLFPMSSNNALLSDLGFSPNGDRSPSPDAPGRGISDPVLSLDLNMDDEHEMSVPSRCPPDWGANIGGMTALTNKMDDPIWGNGQWNSFSQTTGMNWLSK